MKNFFKNKNNLKTKTKGFTLVESLIAITILTVSVAIPLSLASEGLVGANIAQKQIIAFYLAQDAMERIINIKLSNTIDQKLDILNNLSDCKVVGGINNNGCIVNTLESAGNSISPCNGSRCSNGELYKSSLGAYTHSGNENQKSGFIRYIKITPVSLSNAITQEAQIEVMVKWKINGKEQDYSLKTNITKW